MGRVKNGWSSRLLPQTTSDLMALKLGDTTVKNFDPMPSINRWWADTKRTRRFTKQYKSTDTESDEELLHDVVLEAE